MIVPLLLVLSSITQPLLASVIPFPDDLSIGRRDIRPASLGIPEAPRLVRRARPVSPLPHHPAAPMPSDWAQPRPVELTPHEQQAHPDYDPSDATVAGAQARDRQHGWAQASKWRRKNAALHGQHEGRDLSWWARRRNAYHKYRHRQAERSAREWAESRDPVRRARERDAVQGSSAQTIASGQWGAAFAGV